MDSFLAVEAPCDKRERISREKVLALAGCSTLPRGCCPGRMVRAESHPAGLSRRRDVLLPPAHQLLARNPARRWPPRKYLQANTRTTRLGGRTVTSAAGVRPRP